MINLGQVRENTGTGLGALQTTNDIPIFFNLFLFYTIYAFESARDFEVG